MESGRQNAAFRVPIKKILQILLTFPEEIRHNKKEEQPPARWVDLLEKKHRNPTL